MKSKVYHGCKSCLPVLMLTILMYVIVSTTSPVNTEAATTMFDVSSYWGKAGNYTITTEGSIDLTALSSNAGTLNINVSGSNANVVFISDGRIIQNLSITIKGGAKVVLYNVTIDNSTTTNLPPVNAGDNNENNMLYIWGTNTLTGGRFGSGVNVSHMTNLKIDKVYGFDDSTCILNANGGPGGAGIGGKEHNTAGEITILGGTVNAKGGGGDGYSAAGIGGGAKGHGNNVIIKGGIITATGVCGGAGIGGGGLPNNIIANGNDAGVGGRVTIDGGTVVAYGSTTPESGSAGIGGGAFYYLPDGADGATVVINGGTVSAYGYSGGAGIGGACRGGGGNVTINGGIVNATCAGGYGAGIGSGGNSDYAGNVGSITINGGLVKASGSQIDIGCGGLIEQDKLACTYYITGGSINARKVSNNPIVSATDHTLLYYTEVTVPGISSVTKVTYSVDGGTAYHTFVDENGKLYLWLPFKGDGLTTNISVTTSKGVKSNMTVTVNPLSSRWGKSGYILLEKSTTMDITEVAPDAGNLTIIARGSDTTLSLIGKSDVTYKNLCIRINNGAKVVLNNVSIDNGASRFDVIPVEADSSAGNTLYFSGTNTLSSHSTKPGINVPEGSSIIISKVSNESVSNSILKVYGGEEAAAIGARRFVNSGSITILDGTVKAYGGSYAAGIGGGLEGKEGVVYIQGGYVTALRGLGSPYDIGGGYKAKYGGANYLNGGSINVSTIGVEPYSSIAGKQVFFTAIKLPDVSMVTDVKYKVGTTTEFSAATDINGRLYLWLPTEVTEVDIISPNTYHYTGIVSATTSNVFRMTDSGLAFSSVKPSYYENEKTFQVTASGGKGSGAITYSSNDVTVATVSNSGEVTIKKAGQVTITAKRAADNYYHEISASIPITIIEPTLQSIAITSPASKLEYIVGDSLDITGLEVTGTYSDNSTKSEVVATGNVSGFDSSKPAVDQILTVTIDGKTATYQVTIKEAPKPTLQSIAITKPASKLEYIVGDSLDITGLEVTGTYSDNSTKTETVAKEDITGFDNSKPAVDQVLTVTVGGKTATYQVTIKEAPKPTLQSIAITHAANKLEYIVGESLDISGLVVTGTYSDNSTKAETVTTANVSGFNSSKPAVDQVLTVTVGEKTATYKVTIKEAPTPTLQSIAITKPASKLEYIVGDNLDITGLEVTGTYSDNSTKTETINKVDISGFDSSKPAVDQVLTVTIDGKTATYQVTIKEAPKPTLQSIAITKPASKLEYIVGDSLDITGLEVTGTYSDNSTKIETVAKEDITGFDNSKPAVDQVLTVTIGGKTATYQVTIKEAPKPTPTLQSIAITKPASKLEYIVGDSLDISGLQVTGTYSDNSTKIETVAKEDITGFDNSKPAVDQVLTVTIGGKTATYQITIKEAPKPTPTLQSIAITKPASKLEYIVGDSLDITGLEVTGTYSDNSTKTETVAKEDITGFDSSKPAVDQVLTVTIGGKTATYQVTIKEAPKPTLQSIAITKPASKLEYIVGDSLDISGLQVTGTYSDNSTKIETVAKEDITGFDNSKPAVDQVLTVTIGGKTATYQITIKEAPKPTPTLQSIAITKPASKLEYIVGDSLDITGLEVTGTYSDNSTKSEAVATGNVSGFDSSKPVVDQLLTITIEGKTATYQITIKEAPKPTPTLQSIAITKPASKLEYIVGDSLDITGLEVTGTYSDNSTKIETVSVADITGFDSSKPMVDQVLTVTIGGKTATYQITIKEAPKPTPTLQSIAITKPASKLEYIVGDSLDITGLEVTGTYSDNSTKTETVAKEDIIGFDNSKPAVDQVLTVTIGGKTATYQITIKEAPKPTLQSIAITKPANKLEYIVGQSLDIAGLEVTGTYSDNSTKIETVAKEDITGFDSSKPAVDQVLTVTIGGKTATYQVTIKEAPKPPVSAVISPITVSYDLNNPGDVYTTITWNDAKAVDYIISDTVKLTTPNAYAVSGSALVIKNEYIASRGLLQGDQTVFNITFDNGNTAVLTVNIVDGYIPGNDAALEKLLVNNNTVSGFHPDTYEYFIELPYGTQPSSAAATISAIPRDSKASVSVTQAAILPCDAAVAITAEDKITTKLYTVHFLLGAKPNTLPGRRSTVSTNAIIEVPINTKYSLNLGEIFEDENNGDSLSYKVSVNGDTYHTTDEIYTYTPGKIGQVTLVFKANDGKIDSVDTYTATLITDKAPEKSYGLTIKAGQGGSITSGSSGNYTAGTAIPITAIAAPGYSFNRWTSANGGSFNNAYNADTIFTMPEGEEVITASFTYNGDNNTPATGNGNGDNDTSKKDNKSNTSLANRMEVKDWREVGKSLEESTASSLTVDLKYNTVVPEYIFETLVKEDVTMTFVLEEGIEWIVESKNLREAAQNSSEGLQWKAIDLDINLNTDQIPQAQIDALVNTYQQIGGLTEEDKVTPLQLSISHEGSFGFTATLGINLGSANAGKTANLFYYNPATNKLELQATGTIAENGKAYFELTHASDYVIVTDHGDYIKAEIKKLVIQPEKKLLYVGGTTERTTKLKISIPESLKNLVEKKDGMQTITYESSNPKVAIVSASGTIKALKEGKVIITATVTINGVSTEFKSRVTVRKAYISLANNKSSLIKGETYHFHATGYGVDTDKISWHTKERSIVTINKTTGKAVAKKEGTDYIIARSGKISTMWKVTTGK